MKFDAARDVTQGTVDPDPIAAPANVRQEHVYQLPTRQPGVDVWSTKLVLALEGAPGETVTVTLFHRDESKDFGAGARYYQIAAGVVVTANVLQTATVHAGGSIYARVTADAIGGGQTRRLLTTCVP